MPEEMETLEYIHQHFQDHKKVYESDPQVTIGPIHDTLYPQINNDIEYGLFKKFIDSYYLDSQIRDDFQCAKTCYTHDTTASTLDPNPPCTQTYDYISQQLDSLVDNTQQQTLYTNEVEAFLFTTDTATPCTFNIIPSNLETEIPRDVHDHSHNNTGIHFYSKHKYRALLETHIYSIMTLIMVMHLFIKTNTQHRSYKIPVGVCMIQSQLKAIRYLLTGTSKLCHVPCILLVMQVQLPNLIMFHTKLYSTMIKVYFPLTWWMILPYRFLLIMEQHLPFSYSVLTINILYYRHTSQQKHYTHPHRRWYNRVAFLDRTPIELDNQTIQIKVLVCDSECPYDSLLGRTSLAQMSAWQDYANNKLYIQQISNPIVAKNNVRILLAKTETISAALKTGKTTLTPRHTIMGKGVAYVRPFDATLPLRPIEVEFKNNKCCLEIHNSSDSTVEFLFGNEIVYFNARSKGLVQANNLKHFPIDQYLHDRVTPATLSPNQ